MSIEAETVFFHLLSIADDYGRYDARREILMADVFPLRREVSEEALERWLQQLAAADLIRFYEVNGEPYLYLPKWSEWQRLRDSREKFPPPSADLDDSAATRGNSPQPAARARARSENPNPNPSRESEEETGGAARAAARGLERAQRPLIEEPEPAPAVDPIDDERLGWPAVQDAFAAYGRRPTALNASRRAMLRATLREFPRRPGVLVDVVHGYMARHRDHGAGFDPLRNFEPETLYRASNRGKYLEAYDRAVGEGLTPPFLPRPLRAVAGGASRIAPRSTWGEGAR